MLSFILPVLVSLLADSAYASVNSQKSFDFSKGLQGCSVGFADYPVDPNQHGIYELAWEIAPLPNLPEQTGLMISGTNRSDDLFMYAKCYLRTNLKPGSKHSIKFEIRASVDVPAGCSGVGGAPDSLTLKAGASEIEPMSIANGKDAFAQYELNLDKGNQTVGGRDLAVITKTLNNGLNCEDKNSFEYKTITKRSPVASEFIVDSKGGIWIVWGTDSAFESTSTIYYQKISFEIQ